MKGVIANIFRQLSSSVPFSPPFASFSIMSSDDLLMGATAHLLTHASSAIKVARAVQMPYPQSTLQLENHPIDQVRNLRVAVIGAGLAGITAGVLLPAKVPGIKLKIYEKNSDVVSSIAPIRKRNFKGGC